MDVLIKKIIALGVPGLIFVMIVILSGYKGAAAITFALAALGGPFGMKAGLVVLGLTGLLSYYLAEKGSEVVLTMIVVEFLKTKTPEEIINEVNRMWISKSLKLKIVEKIQKIANLKKAEA